MDEMVIKKSLDYDQNSDSLLGEATLPEHEGVTTHVLVKMLSAISTRWKQVVA